MELYIHVVTTACTGTALSLVNDGVSDIWPWNSFKIYNVFMLLF